VSGLSPAAGRALEALCRTLAPSAYEPDGPDARPFDLAAAVERRLLEGDPDLRQRVDRVLRLFDHRATAVVTGRLRRFSDLEPAARSGVLRAWESSAVPARRSIFQVFRRLVLATCYTRPEALAAIGYLGPYHLRSPVFDWEGPLSGESSDDEPVARETRPEPAALPVVASARGLVPDTVLRADVCIVGSGAGGAVAAARLAAAGRDVIVLEEGGAWPSAVRDEDESRMTARLYADGAARFTDDLSILLLQGRGIGGGSTINWMITLRPAPWVMRQWAAEHGAALLGEDTLLPELALIEDEIHARLVPDDAHAPNNRIILDGASRLGWRATPARINARGCLRTGFCGLGCRYGAKQDVGEVYLRAASACGARVLADARADRIRRGGRSRWSVGATVLDPAGRAAHEVAVEADIIVVAGGAVGTPVLLQRSGLGGPAVGRNLRLHPTSAVAGSYDRVMYPAAGIPQSSVCTEFMERNGGYGFWIECPPMLPALAAASLPGFGEDHRARMRGFRRLGTLIVLVRDGAGTDRSQGEVRLGRRGAVRIRYRLRTAEWRTLEDGMRAAARLHLAAGANEAWSLHNDVAPLRSEDDVASARFRRGPNRLALFSAHVNGTCRMSGDAARGACTPAGALRGAPGIYVADGSLFPTAPGVNPQATIMALASLVARGISDRRRPS
jgi:choline dehydrogenase-like flavoprotein